jgi:hypothetical protein
MAATDRTDAEADVTGPSAASPVTDSPPLLDATDGALRPPSGTASAASDGAAEPIAAITAPAPDASAETTTPATGADPSPAGRARRWLAGEAEEMRATVRGEIRDARRRFDRVVEWFAQRRHLP